ncbi:MAG TPA: MFS transporter [Candidatus Limnocylindrales bacterium]|nr:MFS transporter [Candidatus Limnocylindrales bacterium]
MFQIFRKRDFSLMWSAQLVSTIGSALTDLSAGILIFKLTGSALNVGLVLMVTAIPTLFVGLFAGVFVDRFDRKKILLASDLLRGLIVLMIPIAFISLGNETGIPVMYGLLFLSATVRTFFDPAWESVLPEIASEEELTQANSFLSISSFGSTAVGFALAGLLAGIDIHLPFFIDAATFVFSFVLVLAVRVPKAPATDEETTASVVIENLSSGAKYLWRTPLLRSLFLINVPIMLAFGLWNVLLLPMAIKELHATEFEYGLQEGVTSVGFVVGSLIMARYGDRLAEGTWMVAGVFLMGVFGILYGAAPDIQVAIVLVAITGLLNSPMGLGRRLLMQKNIPREMRGRVFSAFAVARDVVTLVGMAGAALADLYPVRNLIIASSLLLVGAGILGQLLPGIGRKGAEWRRTLQLLRSAPQANRVGAGRAATMLDFDRLMSVMPEIGAVALNRRSTFLQDLTVARAEPGEAIVKVGDPGDRAYFLLNGKAVAGIPEEGGYRSLSSMGPGDFFGEIGALRGGIRTANVVADEQTDLLEVPSASLRSMMELPELNTLINEKLIERLGRTSSTDFVRLNRPDQGDLKDLRRRRPKGTAGARA